MSQTVAEIHDISKHYDQPGSTVPTIILNRLSLKINNGESIAIVGPSGSGKTTLLNILGILDLPDSGKILLGGTETTGLNAKKLADLRNRFIGFVFQMHYLLPQLTLLENVLLPVMPLNDQSKYRSAVERAHQLIQRVGLTGQANRRPSQLSLGECQRAAVVRALINQPRLLLADEPTGSLDSVNAGKLGDLLCELQRENNLAIVLVTHSPELASRMEKVYHLSEGNLHLIKQA
jgi:ABC-type lipoprotein export system ATPase subunit